MQAPQKMAANLCCTAEQQGRPGSPELPNARIRTAAHANVHLLPNQPGSLNSHFTSARTDELLELKNIFEGARDHGSDQASSAQKPHARFSRTSMYSLHDLHKMISMRSMIKRRFSKDLVRKDLAKLQSPRSTTQEVNVDDQNTVVRQPRDPANEQLNITKHDLRKDLLSDKGPEEGGYDSDAEVLDDVAKNVGKKAPSKRPSVHSIDWSPSAGSKPTSRSSTKTRCDVESNTTMQPYEIQKTRHISFPARVSHIFSTPNLRSEFPYKKDYGFKRSQSATPMSLPRVSPLSPLRLPSLNSPNKDGRSWAEVLEENLRLPQFPTTPCSVDLRTSETVLHIKQNIESVCSSDQTPVSDTTSLSQTSPWRVPTEPRYDLGFGVQQPAPAVNRRQPKSIRKGSDHENAQRVKKISKPHRTEVNEEDEGYNPRRSVHLHNMHISHHLRSGSLLSWNQLADTTELPSGSRLLRQRTVSDQSQVSQVNKQLSRYERQTSSSEFSSTRMPSKWGKVVYRDQEFSGDVASSIYSSRPHSSPDSLGGSMPNLGRNAAGNNASENSFNHLSEHRRSNSSPTDNEETPRPLYRNSRAIIPAAQDSFVAITSHSPDAKLARKNSVADTKKSKFREELDPAPFRKKTNSSVSLLKFLNPKRISIHSHSEGSLRSAPSIRTGDGVFDSLPVPVDRERRQSRSLMSLNTEHRALKSSNGTDQVWDQALRAHQREKASLFLPENRELAVHASPFRERSGSIATHRSSNEAEESDTVEAKSILRRSPSATLNFDAPSRRGPSPRPAPITRRSAVSGQDLDSPGKHFSDIFDRQGDGIEIVGAWGRYPSHNRVERTVSAGKADRVKSRDFALEAAIQFASAKAADMSDEELDPTERVPSLPLLPGQKKRKKRVGSARIAKSSSMTFGKNLLKNYTRNFKSQSAEFRKHGKNHRSSIAAGGTLDFPELELLPEIWTGDASRERNSKQGSINDKQPCEKHAIEAERKPQLQAQHSASTLRPRRNSDLSGLGKRAFYDGAADTEHDRARAWSAYYETCMPAISRLNSEADLSLEKSSAISRFSLHSRPSSMRSLTMPASLMKHSRNTSNMSGTSVTKHKSVWPQCVPLAENNVAIEERSIFNVRRSTMDLVLLFKEQETVERERASSFTRTQSRRGIDDAKTL